MRVITAFRFTIFFLLFHSYIYADKGDFEKVSLQLQWKHQFQFAGYYIAKEKGFYKEEGLKVDIKEFYHGISPYDVVVSNEATYGTGRLSLIIDSSNGKPIKMINAIFQSSPLVLIASPKSGIKNINDLRDKSIMLTPDESTTASINAMLTSQGLSINDMKQLKHTFNIDDLINGVTDASTAYISAQPYKFIKLGIKPTIFDPKDYGFDFYNDILFTSFKEVENHPNSVKRFQNASLKGWEYAFNNIDETVELILNKYNTQNKTKEALTYEANKLKELAYYKTDKLGEIKKEKIERIYDIYNVMGLIKNKIDFDELIFKDIKGNLQLTFDETKYIKKNKIIRICNNNLYEPIEFAHNGNQNDMRGIALDTLNIIEQNLDIKFEKVHTKSWSQAQQFLKDKKCDIMPAATKNSQRLKYANFTQPYLKLPLAILTNEKNGFVSGIDQIIDKKILRHQGSGLIKILQDKYPNINLVETKSIKDSFFQVSKGEADYTIATIPIISSVTSKYALENIHIAGYTNMVYNLGIAVRDDDILLLNILNKSLDTITKQQHEAIYNKWVNPVVKEKFTDYTLLWQVLIVILFIILAMLYNRFTLKKLNFKLKKEVEAKTKDLKDINKTLEVKIKEEVQKNRKKDALIHEQTKLASMGEMIGNIAHQWRQPLSVISTASSGMQIQKEYDMLTDEIFKESCEAINKNSQYLSKTIDEFRDYIKGDLDIIDFNLKEQNNKFLQLINSDIIKYNINMILDCKEDINIKGYPNNLIECLIHIFNNAKEALVENNKENERYIFISQEIIKNNVIIIIKDNAGGIDESIIHKIFEPYFTTKHQAQGTGLGLHMCYNSIVNNPKGTLDTQNINYFYHGKKYKGAEFKITIPLQVKI